MTLATCSKDLKLYNWPGITLAGIYATPEDCKGIKSFSWSNDGKSLMAIKKGQPFIISMYQMEKKLEPNLVLKNISASLGVYANTSISSIAFGDLEGSVYIYDLKKKRRITEYNKVPSSVNFLDFSYGDTCLATGCSNGNIILYTSDPQPCASYLIPYSHSLSAMTFNKIQPDLLAAGSMEGIMNVWNTVKGLSLVTGRDHTGTITDLAFSGDNITTVGSEGKFINYDLRSSDYTSCYNLNVPITGLAFLQNSQEIAISTTDGELRSYDKRHMTSPLNTVVAHNTSIRKISFQPQSASPISSRPPTKGSDLFEMKNQRHNTDIINKSLAATSAGDFNHDVSEVSSTIMSVEDGEMKELQNLYLHEMLPTSASQIEFINKGTFTYEEFNKFTNDVEEYMLHFKRKMEDKMLNEFYQLRIDMSRQFIELQDKINKSWDGFMNYLKNSNENEQQNEISNAQIVQHASSDVKSSKTKKSRKT